jgi:thiol:disulfide interchange protein DsbD
MTPDVAQIVETAGLPVTLLAAFAAGLLLSLTPCVYPMIPVTVAAFGARRVSRARRLLLSLSYVVGIAATYSLLGTWAATTGRLFGAALANPRVTGAFAVLFAFLAALSFGWIPALERRLARTPGWAVRLGGGSPAGALAMGLVAGVVFAPCVGPFVVGVLAYVAGTGDVALGASLLASVGLGMGAPFVALALASGELARLPRAHSMPELARFVLGALLLVASLYYASLAVSPPVFRAIAVLALSILAVDRGLAAWGDGGWRWAATGAAAALVAVTLWTMERPATSEATAPLAWRSDVETALADARAAGRFAVVDFTADWCLACHELDRVTFRDPEVVPLLAAAERIRVDATRITEDVEKLFARFGVPGLPAVVVVDPSGKVVEEARIASFVPPEEAARRLRGAGLRPDGEEKRVGGDARLGEDPAT